MNCKKGDLAIIVRDLGDTHIADMVGNIIECTHFETRHGTAPRQFGPFMMLTPISIVCWKLEPEKLFPCGCQLAWIPDECLKPLPKLGDEKSIETKTTQFAEFGAF